MGDFYRASQGEEESVTSFATCIEGLLSNVRDKYPQQIPQAKEQQLLKDRLFYGCQRGSEIVSSIDMLTQQLTI